MARVILFGGGDAGGLIIGPNGVRPIPPFDPSLRLQIKGVSAILNGARFSTKKENQEMATLITRMNNLLIEQIEATVGPIEKDNGFVYQDDDGGFTCGSTGKPPIPFPWPPTSYPSLNDLITHGVLERELVDFVNEVGKKAIKIQDALEDPLATAKKMGIKLSEKSVGDLRKLAPSQIKNISDPVDREVVQFFHTVADDGKYLGVWAKNPYETAKSLKVKLSDAAIERISAGGVSTIFDPGTVMNPVAIAVVVGVVIMLVPTEAGKGKFVINDLSGVSKF